MTPADPPKTYSQLETVSDEGDAPAEIGVVLDPSTTGSVRPSADLVRVGRRLDRLEADSSTHWLTLIVLSVLIGVSLAMQVLASLAIGWLLAGAT